MGKAASADGTEIAYDRLGSGSPVVFVGAAFNDRSGLAPLAGELAAGFTVFNYDRRGRGESGDTAPYAVVREVEDLAAVIEEAGGSAAVFGYSSGANLAMKAAAAGLPITKLALYEPPFLVDDSRPPVPSEMAEQLAALIEQGKRGEVVERYQLEYIGMPEQVVVGMRHAPFRPGLEAIAHTLVYDASIVGDLSLPAELVASITTPTLVLGGENSPPVLRSSVRAVADALAAGTLCTLAGQSHEISPEPTAAALREFLAG